MEAPLTPSSNPHTPHTPHLYPLLLTDTFNADIPPYTLSHLVSILLRLSLYTAFSPGVYLHRGCGWKKPWRRHCISFQWLSTIIWIFHFISGRSAEWQDRLYTCLFVTGESEVGGVAAVIMIQRWCRKINGLSSECEGTNASRRRIIANTILYSCRTRRARVRGYSEPRIPQFVGCGLSC